MSATGRCGIGQSAPTDVFLPVHELCFITLGKIVGGASRFAKALQLLVQPVFVWIAHFVTSFFKISRPRCISDFTLASET